MLKACLCFCASIFGNIFYITNNVLHLTMIYKIFLSDQLKVDI